MTTHGGMSTIDTARRRRCHELLDALGQGDVAGVDRCYAPEMTMWFNVTGETSTRQICAHTVCDVDLLAEGVGRELVKPRD